LREQIAGLEAQQAILEQQQAELEVRSPMDGEVLTWNPQSLLEARPLARGQILLTIGDLAGPWQLELRVPDRRVAHVLAARQRADNALPVSFLMASDPARTHRGELDRLGLRTEISERDGAFVLATVALDREQIQPLVPGAGVTAKIYCGRRSLGYVWFHDLLDAVRRWILF
jgi:multidrug efflux pump subunit AcrA (membrane-fusion protein)